jgi:integrase
VGWRSSEITNLTWKNVDRKQGIVRLEAGETKNDDARTVFLDDELKEVFQRQWQIRKDRNTLTPYVYPQPNGKGKIKDFRSAWFSACKAAGLGRRPFSRFQENGNPKYGPVWDTRKSCDDDIRPQDSLCL